jgi:hypothetical protein
MWWGSEGPRLASQRFRGVSTAAAWPGRNARRDSLALKETSPAPAAPLTGFWLALRLYVPISFPSRLMLPRFAA